MSCRSGRDAQLAGEAYNIRDLGLRQWDTVAKAPPQRTPVNASSATSKPKPFPPPKAKRLPASAAAGLRVGRPSPSCAQPGGRTPPVRAASTILARDVALVARSSSRNASGSPIGAAIAKGLLLRSDLCAPSGATQTWPFDVTM